VSRRVRYTRARIRVRVCVDAIAPVVSSRPALSAISLAELALLEPLSELTQIRPRFLAPSPDCLSLSLSLSFSTTRTFARVHENGER